MTALLFLLLFAETQKSPSSAASQGFAQVSKEAAQAREQERLVEAVKLYREAVRLRPDWKEGWWYLGTMFYDQDRYDEARVALRRFTVLDPKVAAAWAFLGLCEFEGKAYDEALARRTDSVDTFYRRAICATELGDFQTAVSDLEQVVRKDINYDFGRALGLYANALYKTGDTDHAGAVFGEAAKINSSSEFMVQYADFLASQGRKNESKDWAKRVLDKRPLMPDYQRRRERRWLRRAAELQ